MPRQRRAFAGLKINDLRRTGARNMRRRGIDRDVIMKIGGWKTDSVFRRYNLLDESDLHEAATRMDQKSQLSHNSVPENRQPEIPPTQDATISRSYATPGWRNWQTRWT